LQDLTSLSSTCFDHKPVFLNFRWENPCKKQAFNDLILKDPDIKCMVNAVVIETYPNHVYLDVFVDESQVEHFWLVR
jgi:hypothetical protein